MAFTIRFLPIGPGKRANQKSGFQVSGNDLSGAGKSSQIDWDTAFSLGRTGGASEYRVIYLIREFALVSFFGKLVHAVVPAARMHPQRYRLIS
jgi:hypothetical protein